MNLESGQFARNLVSFCRIFAHKLEKKIRLFLFSPHLEVSPHQLTLTKLGTNYGGWTFVDSTRLEKSKIVSCGLGEDASFDVEFASRYDATVILVDPTPRAIRHFEEIRSHLGQSATMAATSDGCQPVQSYNLSKISEKNLILCAKALWNEEKKLRFYSPPNEKSVSHSILNYQNNYRTDTSYIEVDAINLSTVKTSYGLPNIELLKLDIEGAEVEVIADMLSKNIFPVQILVEYDEIITPSRKSQLRIEGCHEALLSKGYRLIHFDPPSNFLYTNLKS